MTMSCDLAVELLPWLLNGTLESAERQQVLEHLASCPACRDALADTGVAAAIFDYHPPVTELIAHAGGGEASGDLAEHLAGCPVCAAEVELARTGRLLTESAGSAGGRLALLRPPGGGTAASPPEEDRATSRVWRRAALAAGLGGILALSGWMESARANHALEGRLAALRQARSAPTAERGSHAAGAAGAAGTAGTSVGQPLVRTAPPAPGGDRAMDLERDAAAAQAKLDALARENGALEQRVATLGRIAAETQQRAASLAPPAIESGEMEELQPNEQTERGDAAAAEAVRLSAGPVALALTSLHIEPYEEYEIEIQDARGRRLGGAARIERRRGGQDSRPEFDLVLRRGALPEGTYRLQLFGRTAGGRKGLDTYTIRVS